MNDLALAIAVTGLVILAPVAGATPLGPDAGGTEAPGLAPLDVSDLRAAHSPNGSATDASDANTSTPESPDGNETPDSPGENATTPVAESPDNDTVADSGPPADTSPGSALAGAVSAQGAEVESSVDERAFERRLNVSKHNRSKAAAIATRQAVLEERLATLRNRSRALERAHENGSIGESRYRAEVTALTAKATALERQSNRTDRVARDLPRADLEAAGVNTTALHRLRHDASELSGPETRRIARSIAGRDVGQSMSADRRPEDAGPPANSGGEGRSDRDDRGERGQGASGEAGPEGDRGPPEDADRGSQNASDDRSDRDDARGNATDDSTADEGGARDSRDGESEGAGDEDGGEESGSAQGTAASEDGAADDSADGTEDGGAS